MELVDLAQMLQLHHQQVVNGRRAGCDIGAGCGCGGGASGSDSRLAVEWVAPESVRDLVYLDTQGLADETIESPDVADLFQFSAICEWGSWMWC